MRLIILLTALVALLALPATALAAAHGAAPSAANAAFEIDGEVINLQAGMAVKPVIPGAKPQRVTRLTPNQAVADLDGDGVQDAVVILTQHEDGGGTFYYLAALVGDGQGQGKATNAVVLGDRVQVTKLAAEDGAATVTYLKRRPGEPLGTPPTEPVLRTFRVDQGRLVELN